MRALRPLLGLVFLVMAFSLFWHGLVTKQITEGDIEFQRSHSLGHLFPTILHLRGQLALYEELDSAGAADYLRRAASLQPTRIRVWLDLARVELTEGRSEEAARILSMLRPLLGHVSTWKWQELLLAFDLRDEAYFAECFNFILSRLPHRVHEACGLGRRFWGSWGGCLPVLAPGVRLAYLNQLMRAGEADVALQLWSTLRESESSGLRGESPASPDKSNSKSVLSRDKSGPVNPETITPELEIRFCQFLMDRSRLSAAKKVWSDFKGRRKTGSGDAGAQAGGFICDGGFEEPPLGAAFGWRFARNDDVVIERRVEAPFAGSFSLRLQFTGRKNVAFSHVSQVVPVESGRSYRLGFARKSRNLTTDQGVYLAVTGFKCEGLAARTQPVTGTRPWEEEWLEFSVPPACEAVVVQVRRNASLMFDSKISGDYWLDGIAMEPL